MSEPITFVDWEFHFVSGQLLAVTLQEGRDTGSLVGDMIELSLKPEDGPPQHLAIYRDKLNAIQRTVRVVEPETPVERDIRESQEAQRG